MELMGVMLGGAVQQERSSWDLQGITAWVSLVSCFEVRQSGCSWTLDGFPEREQDLSVCEAVDHHLGDLFGTFFPMQWDEMCTLE